MQQNYQLSFVFVLEEKNACTQALKQFLGLELEQIYLLKAP